MVERHSSAPLCSFCVFSREDFHQIVLWLGSLQIRWLPPLWRWDHMDLDLGTSKFGRHTWDTCNIFIDGPNPTSTSGLIPTYHISGIVTCKDFWKKDNDIPRIYCILYIYIYICLASCTKPLISDVDFLCEGWCVAWTPTSLLPSTKKTATEQWPNPCLLNVFFHFGVIVIPQTDACILYIYILYIWYPYIDVVYRFICHLLSSKEPL